MFGLTRREQRWAAEQKAAELLLGLATTVIKANKEIEVAEINKKRTQLSIDAIWVNNDIMALNAEIGLTMDQLVKFTRIIEKMHEIV